MSLPRFAITRIVCPTDFSDASDVALGAADALAASVGAKVDLLHVWAPPISMAFDAAFVPTPEQIVKYTTDMQQLLHERAARFTLPKGRVDTSLVQGVAWSDLIAHAQKTAADLIVMSTHGRTGLAHFVMGSVTERVVRASPIPVLVVPAPRG